MLVLATSGPRALVVIVPPVVTLRLVVIYIKTIVALVVLLLPRKDSCNITIILHTL